MTAPSATFALSDGRRVEVAPGGILGRLQSAALRLDSAWVSEAHAIVSLRGRDLWLLALRGEMEVDDARRKEVVLVPGQVVRLAQDCVLTVEQVAVPTHVLALQAVGGPPFPLEGRQVWVKAGRAPPFSRERLGRPDAVGWGTGDGWLLQATGQVPRSVTVGQKWQINGLAFEVLALPVESLATPATRDARGNIHASLVVEVWQDHARIAASDGATAELHGAPAAVLRELVVFGNTTRWKTIAEFAGLADADRHGLRRRFDDALAVIAATLREAGIRDDLVTWWGEHEVQVNLVAGDEAVERVWEEG